MAHWRCIVARHGGWWHRCTSDRPTVPVTRTCGERIHSHTTIHPFPPTNQVPVNRTLPSWLTPSPCAIVVKLMNMVNCIYG